MTSSSKPFLCLFFYFCFLSGECGVIVSPDHDVYVLITVTNTTTVDELRELIDFYIRIQVGCPSCLPVITNTPCMLWFGQSPQNFSGYMNTTSQLETVLNSSFFTDKLYEDAKTAPNETQFLDMGWELGLVQADIQVIQQDPKGRIRKKKIAILTNYYYPHFYAKLNGVLIDYMNTTFVSFFVLDGSFIPQADVSHSILPITVFDKSTKNFNYTLAQQQFLNLDVDFNFEALFPPVRVFLELKKQNTDIGLNYLSNIFDNDVCRLINETNYYEVSVLLYNSGYMTEVLFPVPNLEAYTQTYFQFIFSLLVNASASHKPLDYHCKEGFYRRLGAWLIQGPMYEEQFNIYLTDDYPDCMVSVLRDLGADGSSVYNHLDFVIHSPVNNSLDRGVIFDKVTSYLIPYDNATDRASHVFVDDISNQTVVDYLGVCRSETDFIALDMSSPLKLTPLPRHEWVILGALILAFVALNGVAVGVLTRVNQQFHFKKFIRRRATVNSLGSVSRPQFRFASSILAASTVATEVVHEPGPIQFRNWRIPPVELSVNFMETIGRGSSATIYKGFLNCVAPFAQIYPSLFTQNFQKCTVAVKISLNYNFDDSEQINNEITSMTVLGYHQNICSFLGWSIVRDSACMVFELVHSDLLVWSRKFRETPARTPPVRDVYAILWQVSNGMAHIASRKLVHRDLAARNVLLTEDLRVKITDFGLCCNFDDMTYTYTASVTKKLPIKWLGPEAILDRLFSEKSDVWSFGILIFELVTCGIVPYATMSNEEMLDFVRSGKRLQAPEGTPEALTDLMSKCWQADPAERPVFTELRTRFRECLEHESNDYGYLSHDALNGPKSPGIESLKSQYGFIFDDDLQRRHTGQDGRASEDSTSKTSTGGGSDDEDGSISLEDGSRSNERKYTDWDESDGQNVQI